MIREALPGPKGCRSPGAHHPSGCDARGSIGAVVLFNPKGLMARNRNHYHFIRGRKVSTSTGSYWGPTDVVAFAQSLKAQDPSMVVALYQTDFRDALRAALEAAGMRWRYITPDEEEIRHLRRELRDRENDIIADPIGWMESQLSEVEGIRLIA